MRTALAEWIRLLHDEYLADFIPAGGAAVKLAVAPEEETARVLDAVAAAAPRYVVARVDAARTKVHMVDKLFHAVARQIDWRALSERWLRDRLQENGILLDDGQPLHAMDAIAELNDRPKTQLFGEISRLIVNGVMKDYTMCREFRTAMTMLCLGHINPQNVSPNDADVITQWLVGDKCNLGALKRMQIYQKVGRHNARLLLSSLALWLHKVGYAGLVLLADISAVVTEHAPFDNPVRYTRNSVLDTFEVLRQFIDDTDEMAYLLCVAVSGPGLVDEQNVKRNVDNYTALKLRIIDDVRDRHRANPLNAMVRLEAAAREGVQV